MLVTIEAVMGSVRSGVEARWIQGGLAGHGADEEEALRVLGKAAQGWVHGLSLRNELETVLQARGVAWERDGGPLRVRVQSARR